MKHFLYLFLIIAQVITVSCGKPIIGFVTHQPNGVNSKLMINKNLTGNYVCADTGVILINFNQTFPVKGDSAMKLRIKSILSIGQKELINKLDGDLLVLKSSLDSADKFKLLYRHEMDSIIFQNILNPAYSYSIDSIDDWYKIDIHVTSQLFKISENNVYKEFKRKFYFNKIEKDNNYWICTQFEFNRKTKELSINSTSGDDISVIERLTEIEQGIDKNEKNINPSKRTFKKFLRMKGFEDKIKLKKL